MSEYPSRMESPLNASASSAGSMFANSTFEIPPYQREYAWTSDEVSEFWADLEGALELDSYFLGLVILTDENGSKHVVDGQQRILTCTLLAAVLHQEAKRNGRSALAERLRSDFLKSVNYRTDEIVPRVRLTDDRDDATLQALIEEPEALLADMSQVFYDGDESISKNLVEAYQIIQSRLRAGLGSDAFAVLGRWAEFLTSKVYFAVFLHPDPATAYRVFEVINTRGRELTTADLLKNWVLSQTSPGERQDVYERWKTLSRRHQGAANSTFVQFIRHVTTLSAGYVLPRDLYDYFTGKLNAKSTNRDSRPPLSASQLMDALEDWSTLYLQIADPTVEGPADRAMLSVFDSLNSLGVVTVRPVIMAISRTPDATEGIDELLRLVIRRIVVGNLGTGSVERRFSEAAKEIHETGQWGLALSRLADLNPTRTEFTEQLRKRSFNRGTLTFLRRSIVQSTTTPEAEGHYQLIRPRQTNDWAEFPEDDFTYWGSTIGNCLLSWEKRRPAATSTWSEFKRHLLPTALPNDPILQYADGASWDAEDVRELGEILAQAAGEVWYGR